MRNLLFGAVALLIAVPAQATCIGSGSFKTCTDTSGNSYSVSRFGNQTIVNGTSANGSSWSQQSIRAGSNTYTTGRAANGNSWNATSTPYATFGTDSNGDSFYEPN